jgi:hypothetical protein
MAKRFRDSEIWNEDWYIDLPGEYQHLVDFIYDKCDHAGIWKPNVGVYCKLSGFNVSPDSLLNKVNGDKERFIVLENGRWLIPGFIKFQYFDKKSEFSLVLTNKLHLSIYNVLIENSVDLGSIRGLQGVLQIPKEKEKDKDKEKEKVKITKQGRKIFVKPTIDEIRLYCKERQNNVNPEKWLNHYESNGWKVGKNSMKDWKAAVRTWETNNFGSGNGQQKKRDKSKHFNPDDY